MSAVIDEAAGGPSAFSTALRRYRAARRVSQLDLALACGVSARHLSFLETGRAKPSREMVLVLAAGLMLPLGARNALLQAAGFAPVYPASDLDSAALGPFRAVLDEMMHRHAPNPALLCDRHWNVLDASPAAAALLSALHPPDIEAPGIEAAGIEVAGAERNVIRLLADSPASPTVIANLPEVLREMTARLHLEALEAGDDPVIWELLRSLAAASERHPDSGGVRNRRPVLPVIVNSPAGAMSFLSAVAHFGTSEDVTVRDLRLELLFPADEATRTAMLDLAS